VHRLQELMRQQAVNKEGQGDRLPVIP